MSTVPESARRTAEAMTFILDAPRPLTVDRLDALIEWAKTGVPPKDNEGTRGDLLLALFKLRLHMTGC